jgi:hypothetical protein
VHKQFGPFYVELKNVNKTVTITFDHIGSPQTIDTGEIPATVASYFREIAEWLSGR